MPKNKDFAFRIEIIDECLRNRYRKWTLQSLIDAVNDKLRDRYGKMIGRRTIQDDLKYLKENKDAPIEKKKNGKETFFYYSDLNYSIKNLPVKIEEIGYLSDAINILRQINNFQILKDVDEIIRKLKNTAKVSTEGARTIIQFEKHTVAIGTKYIDDIFTAIKERIALRITYQSFRAQAPSTCTFYPYLLKEYRNRWFVVGMRANSNLVINFALDRIKSIKNSNEDFLENELFNPDIYFNNLIGVTLPNGAAVELIKIKIDVAQAPYVRTKAIHYTQEIIKELDNGDIIITLKLICNYELRSVLLGFGRDLEILEPFHLRQDIKEVFEDAISHYK